MVRSVRESKRWPNDALRTVGMSLSFWVTMELVGPQKKCEDRIRCEHSVRFDLARERALYASQLGTRIVDGQEAGVSICSCQFSMTGCVRRGAGLDMTFLAAVRSVRLMSFSAQM
jgi:hypothetical protein